jgi:hypothetical protein
LDAVATELLQLVQTYSNRLREIPDYDFTHKPLPTKWSKKEVLGHLCDSAHNNLRRFICAQYESIPPHIVYDQDQWVALQGYQQVPQEELILLWKLLNDRIGHLIKTMPHQRYTLTCQTGGNSLHSLEWLASDYIRHLKHHLNQIFPGAL